MIVFEKSDLINASRRVYTHGIRQLFSSQNTGCLQVKSGETAREKRKFDCMFDKDAIIKTCALQLYETSLNVQAFSLSHIYAFSQKISKIREN